MLVRPLQLICTAAAAAAAASAAAAAAALIAGYRRQIQKANARFYFLCIFFACSTDTSRLVLNPNISYDG
jgi:hypothetical protein